METIGPYVIERELARGGMGVVYRARDPQLDRPVAVKVLLGGFDLASLDWARFQQEARTTARLRHPNVVGIHTAGRADGRPYLVLDLIEGGSLQDRIEEGPLDPDQAAAIARDLADALHYAHQQGVLHRDLKPHNVLLENGERPLLTDFGLSRLLGMRSGFTHTGEVIGSPAYMSPEQAGAEHAKLGPATDVYGLGATLYAMLTGRPPYHRGTAIDTIEAVRSEPLPVIDTPGVDPALAAICIRCLAKRPEERYPTAFALWLALKDYLEGKRPRTSSQTEPPPVLARRPWRTPALVVGALVVGCLAGASLGRKAPDPAPARPFTTTQELSGEALDRHRRGIQRHQRKDYVGAEEDFDRVLELAPQTSSVWYDRASARLGKKDYAGALEDLDRAASFTPRDPEAIHFVRSKVYLRMKEYALALRELDAALELRPHYPVAHVQRGIVNEKRKDPKSALGDFSKALEQDPRLAACHYRRACILYEQTQLDQATGELEAALKLDPKYEVAHTVRGLIRADRGNQRGAAADHTRSLQATFKKLAPRLRNRAAAWLKLGKWREALIDSAIAIEGDPQEPEPYVFRGVARRALGILQENRRDLREAKQLFEGAIADFGKAAELTQGNETSRKVAEEQQDKLRRHLAKLEERLKR